MDRPGPGYLGCQYCKPNTWEERINFEPEDPICQHCNQDGRGDWFSELARHSLETVFGVAPVYVANNKDFTGAVIVNMNLDRSSKRTIVTEWLLDRIGVDWIPQTQIIRTVTGISTLFNRTGSIYISSIDRKTQFRADVSTAKIPSGIKPTPVAQLRRAFKELRTINFPQPARRPGVDVLLGLDQFEFQHTIAETHLGKGRPIVTETLFGKMCIYSPVSSDRVTQHMDAGPSCATETEEEKKTKSTHHTMYFVVSRDGNTTAKHRAVYNFANRQNSTGTLSDAVLTGQKLRNNVARTLAGLGGHGGARAPDIGRMHLRLHRGGTCQECLRFHMEGGCHECQRFRCDGQTCNFTRWVFGNTASRYTALQTLNEQTKTSNRPEAREGIAHAEEGADFMPLKRTKEEDTLTNEAGAPPADRVTNSVANTGDDPVRGAQGRSPRRAPSGRDTDGCSPNRASLITTTTPGSLALQIAQKAEGPAQGQAGATARHVPDLNQWPHQGKTRPPNGAPSGGDTDGCAPNGASTTKKGTAKEYRKCIRRSGPLDKICE